ncbi:MAG: hypothetical protein JEZ04_07140 [Spirochaetales bacterium]|nr:hypothetical protein [Spirochaetales bacterium]
MKDLLKKTITVLFFTLALFSCTYSIPYISLGLKQIYTQPDIIVNYSYVCESRDQRCVYKLYNKAEPSEIIYSEDAVLPHTGVLTFSGLEEGDYILFFSVYSEKDGEYSLLSFLDKEYEFTIDIP